MTAYSLYIRECPDNVTPEALETAWLEAKVVIELSSHARDVGPYTLAEWAGSRGQHTYYIDNCWVRVPVSAAGLKAFYSDVLNVDNDPKLASVVRPGQMYLIEAEEF